MRLVSCALRALRDRAVLAFGVDQFQAALDHVGGVASLDRLDERAVDEAELEVGAAVPHRKRRRLDQVSERIERAFGLAQPRARASARSSSPALVSKNHSSIVPGGSGAGAGPPRTSNTRGEPVRAHLARNPAGRNARRFDVGASGASRSSGQSRCRCRPARASPLGCDFEDRARAAAAHRLRCVRRPGPRSGRAGAELEQAGVRCAPRRAPAAASRKRRAATKGRSPPRCPARAKPARRSPQPMPEQASCSVQLPPGRS